MSHLVLGLGFGFRGSSGDRVCVTFRHTAVFSGPILL